MAPATSERTTTDQIVPESLRPDQSSMTARDEKFEEIDVNTQAGVRAVEAAASVWETKHLIAAYVM